MIHIALSHVDILGRMLKIKLYYMCVILCIRFHALLIVCLFYKVTSDCLQHSGRSMLRLVFAELGYKMQLIVF